MFSILLIGYIIFCFMFSSLFVVSICSLFRLFNLIFSVLFVFFLFLFFFYRRLRKELHKIRLKGAIKVENCGGSARGGSLDRPFIEANQLCSRCGYILGRVVNSGASCRRCRARVCRDCRNYGCIDGKIEGWVCILCHEQM